MMGPLRSASSMARVFRFGPFFLSPRFLADTPSSKSAHMHFTFSMHKGHEQNSACCGALENFFLALV